VVTRSERAWQVLDGVPDPEVPALSVRDLGIVRELVDHGEELEVVLTPTYSGCPATEVIERSVLEALEAEGLGPARATLRRAPAWTTDWISEAGREKLRAYGIAPPGPVGPAPHSVIPAKAGIQGIRIFRRQALDSRLRGNDGVGRGDDGVGRGDDGGGRGDDVAIPCPHCGSARTERLSAFGSTACKALYRCLSCREPFEHFKPI
jgi:ring-1,2-phenylacetyl-CoA epoxidase subunit PaaD